MYLDSPQRGRLGFVRRSAPLGAPRLEPPAPGAKLGPEPSVRSAELGTMDSLGALTERSSCLCQDLEAVGTLFGDDRGTNGQGFAADRKCCPPRSRRRMDRSFCVTASAAKRYASQVTPSCWPRGIRHRVERSVSGASVSGATTYGDHKGKTKSDHCSRLSSL